MPRLSRDAAAPEEHLLTESGRDAVVIAVVVALTAGLFAAVAEHGVLIGIQRLDDAWLRLMISGRGPPLTAIAKVFNLIGLVYVTLPVRIAVAGFLAVRRRWWHLAAFTAAVVLSEVLIGLLKGLYGRARPLAQAFKLPSASKLLLVLAVVAALVGVVLATRKGRRFARMRLLQGVQAAFASLRTAAASPARLALLFGGSSLVTLAYIGGCLPLNLPLSLILEH